MVQTAVDEANGSKATYVLLVLGKSSSEILEKINPGRAQVIFNKDYQRGIATSIKAGLANVPGETSAVIIMVADQPFLRSSHLDMLIEQSERTPGRIVALSHGREPRNPVLVPEKMFPALEKLTGDEGARSMVRKNKDTVLLEVEDQKVFSDVDTKDSLLELEKSAQS